MACHPKLAQREFASEGWYRYGVMRKGVPARTWNSLAWQPESAYVWQMIPKDDRGGRGRLFMHEPFHCIQPRLGSIAPRTASTGENTHLDSLEGRYWMRLEWRALARAHGPATTKSSGSSHEPASAGKAAQIALESRPLRKRPLPEGEIP